MGRSIPPNKRRLCVPEIRLGSVDLDEEEAHYLRTVLRLKIGDQLEVFDGRGQFATATLNALEKRKSSLQIDSVESHTASPVELTVAMATPKSDRSDWTVEKLCELGVHHITWLHCERSVTLPKKEGQRLARWSRIAKAAAGQSGRYFLPSLSGPIPLSNFLQDRFERQFIGSFSSHFLGEDLLQMPQKGKVSLLIGPEGGFTEDELQKAIAAGYQERRLGHHILRTETAAIAGASILGGAIS